MSGMYDGISDEAIALGLSDGRFSQGTVRQIRDEKGLFVKHIKMDEGVDSRLPSTVIQVSQRYVYQADLRPIMDAIIGARREQMVEDLGDRYDLILTKLERYINHRTGLEGLIVESNEAATLFEKRLQVLLNEFQPREPDAAAGKTLVSILKAYVNVQFVYLISTFWSDRESVERDTAFPRRLREFEEAARKNFEQLLAYQYDPRQGLHLSNTLYAKYFLQGPSGINHLEAFLQKDKRFGSLTNFLQFFNKHCLTPTGETDFYNSPIGDARFAVNITIDQTPFENDKRHLLACEFSALLDDIHQLWNLYEELKGAGNIEPGNILLNHETAQTEIKKLTAIPLQLPKSS